MIASDIIALFTWWLVLFFISICFLPLTIKIFSSFFDKGYIFGKVIGIIIISYVSFILGILHIVPFSQFSLSILLGIAAGLNFLLWKKEKFSNLFSPIFIIEEGLFLTAIFSWAYIRSFQPDIHGLEKFMDFGFINSILRSTYFPPKDMWYTPLSINYYYFGHLTTAVLTKLSGLPSLITFNLMVATIFAFTFVQGFSIGGNLWHLFKKNKVSTKIGSASGGQDSKKTARIIHESSSWSLAFGNCVAGLITAAILTFAGNIHTIYTFFKPYDVDHPVPFWNLAFSPSTFPNAYWYPNATRFIYHTIHEFPLYSFVVSDLHGHVLDIPFVLLTIAVLIVLILNPKSNSTTEGIKLSNLLQSIPLFIVHNSSFIFIGFLLAVLYMTNAWDGAIYFILATVLLLLKGWEFSVNQSPIKSQIINYYFNYLRFTIYQILTIFISFIIFSIPFSIFFKAFVSGIGLNCAPSFLTHFGHFGPLLFEPNHCQLSPWWQIFILHGFFYFFVLTYIIFIYTKGKYRKITNIDIFIFGLIIVSSLLIIAPEFVYLKDIYDTYFRANTMFKLVYQAFLMLSLVSGFVIMRIFSDIKQLMHNKLLTTFYLLLSTSLIALVMMYPYFAINSYYNNLNSPQGLDGNKYLYKLYPTDYQAIQWINQNIKNQPILLEAQGDSYTDYERVSSSTGLPTVFGWTVHEWLWRGTYDIAPPRITDVQTLYESTDLSATKILINKYHIKFVFIGDLERKKYNVFEKKFMELGTQVYRNGETAIYQLHF